jgi:hypothetical protein
VCAHEESVISHIASGKTAAVLPVFANVPGKGLLTYTLRHQGELLASCSRGFDTHRV